MQTAIILYLLTMYYKERMLITCRCFDLQTRLIAVSKIIAMLIGRALGQVYYKESSSLIQLRLFITSCFEHLSCTWKETYNSLRGGILLFSCEQRKNKQNSRFGDDDCLIYITGLLDGADIKCMTTMLTRSPILVNRNLAREQHRWEGETIGDLQ